MSLTEIPNGLRWSADPEERVYRPPVAPEPFVPPPVSATAVNGLVGGTVVERADAAFAHALASLDKFRSSIETQHYTQEGLAAHLSKFADTDAAKAVDKAVDSLQARADQAAAKLAKIEADLSPDGDTAAELRATRFWDRTKPLLDNAKEGAVIRAQKLISAATREQLGTLLQELPAYLEALNQPTDWITAAIGQAVPEYAQAAKQHRSAQQALLIGKTNAQNLRRAFTSGHMGSQVVLVDSRKYDPDKG
jgi:hypothetical protein